MIYRNFNSLISTIKQRAAKKNYAVAACADMHTLEASLRIFEEGLANPVLIGDEQQTRSIIRQMGKCDEGLTIINVTEGPEACAQKAVDLVNSGEASFIAKGLVDTAVILRTVLKKENNLLMGGLVSTVSFVEIPTYHKLICATDCGLNMYPDFEQKKFILKNAVDTLERMGVSNPKVAALCAIEKLNLKMPETVDAQALKEMNLSGEINNCIIEGPISYDIAMCKDAAEVKGLDSPVAGDPDILLFPNITSGNLTIKGLVYSGGAKSAGMAVGLKVPLVLTSRSASADEKYLSILLAAI